MEAAPFDYPVILDMNFLVGLSAKLICYCVHVRSAGNPCTCVKPT